MAAEIRWSTNAIEDYNLIVEYLLTEWNEGVALRFVEVFEYKILRLSQHPSIGVISSRDGDIRNISVTKHNRLYYRLLPEQTIELVNIFGTRQDPERNKFE
jgi:plasmid stabilization system protein ParE